MFVVTPEEPQGVIILFDYSGSCLVIPLSFHKRASLFRPWFFEYPIEGAVMAFEISVLWFMIVILPGGVIA